MIKVLCYGELQKYETREEAIDFYNECYANSDGAEQERYSHILIMLTNRDVFLAYDLEDEFEMWKQTDNGRLEMAIEEMRQLRVEDERRHKKEKEDEQIEKVANTIYEILSYNTHKLKDNTYVNLTDYNDIFFDIDGKNYEIKIHIIK